MNSGPQPYPVKDSNWARLSRIADLSEAARPELENILGWGKFLAELDSRSSPPWETKRKLVALRRKAERLFADLRSLDGEVFMALVHPEGDKDERFRSSPFHPPLRTQHNMLSDRVGDFESWFLGWVDRALARVPPERRGSKTAAAQAVTRGIDELLRRHEKPGLAPSEKTFDPGRELLQECLTLLRMDLTARAMIRRLASERRKVPAETK